MHYTLTQQNWQAVISGTGAELQSLLNTADQDEYIWQGDPAVWSGRAPILFPIIGRLKNGIIHYDGQAYALPMHGLVKQSVFECIEQSADRLVLSLRADEETLTLYPRDFELQVHFQLSDNALAIAYTVINHDSKSMLFTLGSHPAFRLSLNHARLSDYIIEFSEPETLDRYTLLDGLMPLAGEPYLDNSRLLSLNDSIFDDDALIFKNISSKSIAILHREHGKRVSVDTGGAPHLGIWAKPGAAYVCIEPWHGFDDPVNASGHIEDKPGMLTLPASEDFHSQIIIRPHPWQSRMEP